MSENPYAGQGPVLLDIGGDVGALIVEMPAELEGLEVEIRPAGEDDAENDQRHSHDHGHSHDQDHGPSHGHDHDHDHGHSHDPARPHVAVVARSVGGSAVIPSLVYPELVEGRYELYRKDGGPVELTATIVGGEVTTAIWPGASSTT